MGEYVVNKEKANVLEKDEAVSSEQGQGHMRR